MNIHVCQLYSANHYSTHIYSSLLRPISLDLVSVDDLLSQSSGQIRSISNFLFAGFMALGSAAASTFLSGILTRKLKLGLGGCLRAVCLTQAVACVIIAIGALLVCPQAKIQQFDMNKYGLPKPYKP